MKERDKSTQIQNFKEETMTVNDRDYNYLKKESRETNSD